MAVRPSWPPSGELPLLLLEHEATVSPKKQAPTMHDKRTETDHSLVIESHLSAHNTPHSNGLPRQSVRRQRARGGPRSG
jgi:hypothetical protein